MPPRSGRRSWFSLRMQRHHRALEVAGGDRRPCVERPCRLPRAIAARSSGSGRAKHVVDDVLLRNRRIARMADADAQPPEPGVPSCASISRKPLWPASPPPNLSFDLARQQIELVVNDERSRRRRSRRIASARQPSVLRGSCTWTASAAARRRHARPARETCASLTNAHQSRAASASANQKPALCRVASCSRPGLPRPTTKTDRCIHRLMAVEGASTPPAQQKGPPSYTRRALVPIRREGYFFFSSLAGSFFSAPFSAGLASAAAPSGAAAAASCLGTRNRLRRLLRRAPSAPPPPRRRGRSCRA